MSVNPNLATLMRVIEDQQDKMPEGEYLEAMNALGALHRIAPAPPPAPAAGHPPSYAASSPLFGANPNSYNNLIAMMGQYGYLTWTRVTRIPEYRQMTANQWVALTQEQQNALNREATFKIAESHEYNHRNPDPTVCVFIARHAVGPWTYGNEFSKWTCACGYNGKSKNWQRHEQSDRHQDWAQHRIVPRRTIEMMKSRIAQDEDGELVCFNYPLTGGIRYFLIGQERNEWTDPELYPEVLRLKEEAHGVNEWFVYPRDEIPPMTEV